MYHTEGKGRGRKRERTYENMKISHKRNHKNSYLESKKKKSMLLQEIEAVDLGLLFTSGWEISPNMKNDAKTY